MTQTPTTEEDLYWARVEALATAYAAKRGLDYAKVREFGEEPVRGPHKDIFNEPAADIIQALDRIPLTLAEVVAALQPFETEQ